MRSAYTFSHELIYLHFENNDKLRTVLERFLRRLFTVAVTFILSLCFIWLCLRILPGDSSSYLLGDGVNESAITDEIGLGEFLLRAVTFSFGPSAFAGKNVNELIAGRIAPTLLLALLSLALAVAFTSVMIWLEIMKGSDRVFRIVCLLSYTLPAFVTALLLMLVFAKLFGYLPSYRSSEPFVSALFPAVNLAFMHSGLLMRSLHEMIEGERALPYARFVLSKGATENRMLFMHVLSNVAAGVMVLLDQSFISLFASSAAVETLFSYPGLGSLMVSAIARRDSGTIAGMMIITCMLSSVLSIAEDLLLSVLDERRGREEVR